MAARGETTRAVAAPVFPVAALLVVPDCAGVASELSAAVRVADAMIDGVAAADFAGTDVVELD